MELSVSELSLESPGKRRKLRVLDPRGNMLTSTPLQSHDNRMNILPTVSVSKIPSELQSSSSRTSLSAQSLASLQDGRRMSKIRAYASTSSTDLQDEDDSSTTGSDLDESTAANHLDYDAFFENLRGFRKTGKAWNWFKPLRGEDSQDIYSQIFKDVRNTEEVAQKFVDFFKEYPDEGLNLLMTLVVDCAGYGKFDISHHIKESHENKIDQILKSIITYSGDGIFNTGRFLFHDKGRQSTVLKMAIFSFVQKFVLYSYGSKLLFRQEFEDFMKFLYELNSTEYSNLVYTGSFFNMKIITAILMLVSDLERRNVHIRPEKLQQLNMFIDAAYLRVTKVCKSDYLDLTQLKLGYVRELELWINYEPKLFLDHFECWKVLAYYLIEDAFGKAKNSASVRLATLNLLKKIILSENVVPYLKNVMDILIKRIGRRFQEANDAIAIKALEVYKDISVHYYNEVENNRDIYESMIEMIADHTYKIGKAAGNILIDLLRIEVSDGAELIGSLARTAQTYHPKVKHFFVEALIDHPCKILQNWKHFMEIFSDASVDVQEKLAVGDILLESVDQTLNGKSSEMRENSRNVSVSQETRESVVDYFMPNLKRFLTENTESPAILQILLKIVVKFDIRKFTDQHNQYLDDVLAQPSLLQYNGDLESFEAIADFLLFAKKHESSKTKCNGIVDAMGKRYADEYIEQLEKEYVKQMMLCCRYSVIFKLGRLGEMFVSREVEEKLINNMTGQLAEFLGNCFNILAHSKGEMCRNTWVEISETHLLYAKELENINKQRFQLRETLPKLLDDDQLIQLFFKVYDKRIVNSEKVPENDRRKYAMNVINMAIYGSVPLVKLTVLFKYYDQMFGTYSQIVEDTLNYIQRTLPAAIPNLVYITIISLYMDVRQKHGVVDPRSSAAKTIVDLSRRFKNLSVVIPHSGHILFKLVRDVKHRDLLAYFIPFIDNIAANDKIQILEIIREQFPAVKSPSVSLFFNRLESTGDHSVRPKRKGPAPAPGTSRREAPPLAISTEPANKRPKNVTTELTTPMAKGKGKKRKQLKPTQSTESDSSAEISLHDTSDPSDEFLNN